MVPRIIKSAKILSSLYGGGGGDWSRSRDQLPTFDAESKSAEILKSLWGGGGGGAGGGGSWDQLPSFDAGSKYAKI